MTDRIHSLTVVLEEDRRDDDVKYLVAAIRQFRNVLTVETNVSDITTVMAESRAKIDMKKRLLDVMKDMG